MNFEKNNLLKAFSFILVLGLFLIPNFSFAKENNSVCAVYITGIGCSNCAVTDPVILSDFTAKYPEFILVEYEIYQNKKSNLSISDQYFANYLLGKRSGIPFLVFGDGETTSGRFEILKTEEKIKDLAVRNVGNNFPLMNGEFLDFDDLDLNSLPGEPTIFSKERALIFNGGGEDNKILHKLLMAENINDVLKEIEFREAELSSIEISDGELKFDRAVELNGWILKWKDKNSAAELKGNYSNLFWILPFTLSFILGLVFFLFRKKFSIQSAGKKKVFILVITIFLIIGLFFLAKCAPVEFIKEAGGVLPLPLFTFLIALVDGFNPCNLFVLTLLLGFLISVSHERKKIYLIGYTFIAVVFVIYFVFMVFWLNIFQFIGFITPLRILIAVIAIVAGIINCKELFAFRKGITLMIQDKYKGILARKVENMKNVIKKGSIPILISSSVALSAFASLVELPCTAGFPIIYTGILTGKILESSLLYYFWLFCYNVIYVMPLIIIVGIFGLTFKKKQINQKQMEIIKFIGGAIMILLGIILLINPELVIPIT